MDVGRGRVDVVGRAEHLGMRVVLARFSQLTAKVSLASATICGATWSPAEARPTRAGGVRIVPAWVQVAMETSLSVPLFMVSRSA